MKKLPLVLAAAAFGVIGYASEVAFDNSKLSKILGSTTCSKPDEGGNSCGSQFASGGVVGDTDCTVYTPSAQKGMPDIASPRANVSQCAEGKGHIRKYSSTTDTYNEENRPDKTCPQGTLFTCLPTQGTPPFKWVSLPQQGVQCGKQSIFSAATQPNSRKCAPETPAE